MKMFPCWRVDVRHERNSGAIGHFRSRPVTLTEARQIHAQYAATGTPVQIECIDELATLHRQIVAKELNYEQACDIAREIGYDV